jgi:hypothetical protein
MQLLEQSGSNYGSGGLPTDKKICPEIVGYKPGQL